MIDLLRDEANRNFPNRNKMEEYFTLHCSPSFAVALLKEFASFRDSHFFVVDTEDEPVKVSQFLVPGLGHVNIVEDMLQGYRLECVSCENRTPAPLPHYITVLKEFPHMSSSYCADKNMFMKGDVLMDGRERYTIMTDPMPYEDESGTYFVYTFDKPLENPIGKRLMIEYLK